MGYMPGGKRTIRSSPDEFMENLLRDKLSWLPMVIITGWQKSTQEEDSYRYGIPSKYIKTVHYAELSREKAGHAPMGLEIPLCLDATNDSADESGCSWQKQLAEVQIFAVIQRSCDADLFAWLPPDLFEALESPDVKPKIKPWISRSKGNVESIMDNYMLLQQRWNGREDRNRRLKITYPDVDVSAFSRRASIFAFRCAQESEFRRRL